MTDVHVVGIPMDLGAGRRGVDMGPSALRLAGLATQLRSTGAHVHDHGNVDVPVPEATHSPANSVDGMPFLDAIAGVAHATKDRVERLDARGTRILMGGDHAVSIGTVSGVVGANVRAGVQRTGVIWIDAHADLNTPDSSPSGNVHGMPLAVLLGLGHPTLLDAAGEVRLDPSDIVMIGLRSVDPAERRRIAHLGILAFTMSDVDRLGMAEVIRRTDAHLRHAERWHVSLDADVLDPSWAPGVGTPVPGGLTYREAHLAMESFAATSKVGSVDLVEVNPILDERNATASAMVDLACSLLGKSIL